MIREKSPELSIEKVFSWLVETQLLASHNDFENKETSGTFMSCRQSLEPHS